MSSGTIKYASMLCRDRGRKIIDNDTVRKIVLPKNKVERSYFYKADSYPEIVANRKREFVPLSQSCIIKLP